MLTGVLTAEDVNNPVLYYKDPWRFGDLEMERCRFIRSCKAESRDLSESAFTCHSLPNTRHHKNIPGI